MFVVRGVGRTAQLNETLEEKAAAALVFSCHPRFLECLKKSSQAHSARVKRLRQDDHDGGHLVRAILCGERCGVGVLHVTSDDLGSCTGDQLLALRTNRMHVCHRAHHSNPHLHFLELLRKLRISHLESLHPSCWLCPSFSDMHPELAITHRVPAREPSVNILHMCSLRTFARCPVNF